MSFMLIRYGLASGVRLTNFRVGRAELLMTTAGFSAGASSNGEVQNVLWDNLSPTPVSELLGSS